MEKFFIIAFDSTHHAMSAEKSLKNINLPVQVIPVPKEITLGCGLSLKINEQHISQALENLLENKNISFKCFIVEKEGLKKNVYPYKF